MEFIKQFISEYGTTVLYTILTALAGYLGIVIKNLYTKYINDKTKKEVAKTVVVAVQQLYKNLDGEQRLNKALEAMSEMLAEKGIQISQLEMRMLIEASVGEFKEAFKTSTGTELGLGVEVEPIEIEGESMEEGSIAPVPAE